MRKAARRRMVVVRRHGARTHRNYPERHEPHLIDGQRAGRCSSVCNRHLRD